MHPSEVEGPHMMGRILDRMSRETKHMMRRRQPGVVLSFKQLQQQEAALDVERGRCADKEKWRG